MYSGRMKGAGPRPSDVIAEDFFVSPEIWQNAITHYPERARKNKLKLNKQLAHVAYDHLESGAEERLWDFDGMINDLSPAIEAFYRRVDWEFFEDMSEELQNPVWYGRVRLLFRQGARRGR